MGRLIDADLLIERIKRNDDLPWNLDPIMKIAFESCVNHSPTAYDVDKVIEQVKLERGVALFNEAYYWIAVDLNKAIRIIEKGGIE